jgi:hypothetical protein
MSNTTTVTLRGKASYAKILGDPIPNYNKDGREWKMDLILDKTSLPELKKLGISDRVKSKEDYNDGAPYLTFKQAEFKKDGSPNRPIQVVDSRNQPWGEDLIGNGSDVDVKFVIVDYGPGKKDGVYIRGVRVLNLVSYNKPVFDELDEDDPFYNSSDAPAGTADEDDDINL